MWTSRGHYAQWGLLLARSDPTVPKHAGITVFGLDLETPGVEIRPLRQMNGDTHFTEVFLTGVRIPDRDRIGPVGGGWRVALTTLAHERGGVATGGGSWLDENRLDRARPPRTGSTAIRSCANDSPASSSSCEWHRSRCVGRGPRRSRAVPGPRDQG